jgi:hypothetical protein
MTRRPGLLVASLASAFALAAIAGAPGWAHVPAHAPARGDDRDTQGATSYSDAPHLEQAHRMADKALAFLAAHMRTNGSLERVNGQHFPSVASTALAVLAFMANGHTADEGTDRYGPQVRLMLDWLLTQAQSTPCQCADVPGAHVVVKIFEPGFNASQVHEHGYATWALAMAYGMSFGADNEFQRARLKTLLQGAVHALELSQAKSGGWYYTLEAGQGEHEGSTTVTVLQALRAAKEAGVRVDVGCIRRAIDYLGKLQVSEGQDRNYGGFRYRQAGAGTEERVTFALTAASIASLNQTGDYDSKFVDRGIAYMRQKDPLTKGSAQTPSMWPWYERLYATQAYFQYRELRYFRQWYPELVNEAAGGQGPDGSFSDSDYGDVYATATAALTLAVPFGYLPTFQR